MSGHFCTEKWFAVFGAFFLEYCRIRIRIRIKVISWILICIKLITWIRIKFCIKVMQIRNTAYAGILKNYMKGKNGEDYVIPDSVTRGVNVWILS